MTPFGSRAAWAVAAVVSLAVVSGALRGVDRATTDALQRFGAGAPPEIPAHVPDVAMVALDPQSLRAFPDWPWPRDLYARAIERLDAAGAKAIGLDIDFSTARGSGEDAALARAIGASHRVVLASFRQLQLLANGAELEVVNTPTAEFTARAAGLGVVLVPVDSDGIVRRAPRERPIGARPLPSLSAAVLAVATGSQYFPDEGEPLDSDFPIDYRRASPRFPVLSMVDVVEGRFDPRDVAGRAVFIGATAAEFQDLWSTPLGPARPGVFIQAVAYRTLAAEFAGERVLAILPVPAQVASVVALSFALVLFGTSGHGRRLAALGAAALGWTGVSLTLAMGPGLLVAPAAGWLVIASHYVLGLEGVRRRVGRIVAQQESSLTALAGVGTLTTQPASGGDLSVALGLLGDVVGASGVALFRAGADGELDGRRLEWLPEPSRGPAAAIGDTATAARVLAGRSEELLPLGAGRAGVAVYVSLRAGEEAMGVLAVECEGRPALDPTQRRTITTVATQLALSAHNLRLIDSLRETFNSSIAALATAVEARDGYTDQHCRRLAAFSRIMAERLGLPEDEIHAIELGALLHDVGKIGICDAILNKPGRFTPEERRTMQAHPVIGAKIVGGVLGLSQSTLDCVHCHHEYWDGSGYPEGLVGEQTPLAARIVAVVDVWDALSSARPYKPAFTQERVRGILRKGRGAQFDPEMVDLFLTVLDEQGEEMLNLIDQHCDPSA